MLAASDLRPLLQAWRGAPRWWLACSGGLDSSVLLTLVSELCNSEPGWPALHAIHVDHGLHPDAPRWAESCVALCATHDIPLHIERVRVDVAGEGLEAAARRARYAAFEALLQPGDCLLLGHHADDQAETLMLNLLRGSGSRGLAGMPMQRPLAAGQLLRPLLGWPRTALEAVARNRGLGWIDDPANMDPGFDRNWLRAEVLPRIAMRWPGYRAGLAEVARLAAASAALEDEVAVADLAALSRGEALDAAGLAGLSPTRRDNALRYWLRGHGLPSAPRRVLACIDELLQARADASPQLQWPGASLRRYAGRLYALPALPSPPGAAAGPWPWQPPAELVLPELGVLRARAVDGAGLRAGLPLQVRPRRGGERSHPAGRAHSQTLRRLLQEYRVPPWWRERLPLVYSGDELVAVADYWVEARYRAAPGEAGWQIEWCRPGLLPERRGN